jgi:hypothetical protein
MACVSRVVAATVIAATVMFVVPALADSVEPSRHVDHFLFFSGEDIWRQGLFLYGGSVWAPSGLDANGIVVKIIGTRGVYRYRSGAFTTDVTGVMYGGTVMPGFHFTWSGMSMTLYAGIDEQWHFLVPLDLGNAARGYHTGVRAAAELWVEPTSRTMVTAAATATTIASAYALRIAGGWRVFDGFYVGPEALVYGAANYQQWRVGLQGTGLKLWTLDLQAAIGYAIDNDASGLYARVGLTRKQ